MMGSRRFALLCLLAAAAAPAQAADDQSNANPIRKVVALLQGMQKRVEAEGEKEKELYDKFSCYCRSGGGDLSASIQAAGTKVPALGSDIEASEAKLTQTKEDLKEAQVDRTAAKGAVQEATAIREKEAAAFAAEKADYDANIAAITKAVQALEKGMSGTFLQTQAASVLRRLAQGKADMLDADRQALVAFLSGSQGSGYAPQSGEITGILKEIGDTMQKGLAEATAEEETAVKSYTELMAAKTKEIEALTASIGSKTKQIGELGVSIVQMKADLTDTEAALLADQQYLAELEKSCSTKTAEWEERSKTRAEELVALADTIKVLNDDDALDLFKKTLPSASASFVQMTATANRVRVRALAAIHHAQQVSISQNRPGLDLLALVLSGKKALSQGGFETVIKMVDKMVEVLKQEQVDDDNKKEYCGTQLDSTDDKKKGLDRTVQDTENAIATATEGISTLTEEIKALEAGIKDLDKAVAEATEQRQAENADYKELMASDSAAKELLGFAKNRLNKFYNPKLYKAPPKRELSQQDRIASSMAGTEPPTPPPGGIAGTGIAVLAQVSAHTQRKDAPAPPPETWGAYATKSSEGTGVIAMIDLLIKDLDKELAEAATEEKNGQADYETMMKESAQKRTADSKSLTQKGSAKAGMEADLEAYKGAKAAATKELMATVKYIESLHSECDWLLQYFDVRKEARAGEVDALGKAKAVLSGADFSLLQRKTRGFLERA